MYRNQFIKKTNNFKTMRPVGAVPDVKPGIKKVIMKKTIKAAKAHSNSIGTSNIRNLNIEENKILMELFDNIDIQSSSGLPLDYVKKSAT